MAEPKNAKTVKFNDGSESATAIVKSTNEDGTLNLVYFPSSSPVEHANNIPYGGPSLGRTWHV